MLGTKQDFGNIIQIAEVDDNPKKLLLINWGSEEFPVMVVSYQCSRAERIQVMNCLNDFSHIYAFGKEPMMGTISGVARLEEVSKMYNAYMDRYRIYQNNPLEIKLFGDMVTATAYLTRLDMSVHADNPTLATFNISFIATDKDNQNE